MPRQSTSFRFGRTEPGVDIVKHSEGADPAAVVFDTINAAKARNCDIVIIDTAGRLHNKKNLMEELKKINRVLEREYPEAYRGNFGRSGCNDRTECTFTGKGIQ